MKVSKCGFLLSQTYKHHFPQLLETYAATEKNGHFGLSENKRPLNPMVEHHDPYETAISVMYIQNSFRNPPIQMDKIANYQDLQYQDPVSNQEGGVRSTSVMSLSMVLGTPTTAHLQQNRNCQRNNPSNRHSNDHDECESHR